MENERYQNLIPLPLKALEALLFIYGEPIEVKKMLKILNRDRRGEPAIDEQALKIALQNYKEKLENDDRGLMLIMTDDEVQLVTKPEFRNLLEVLIKEELHEALTPAALETLAIIAYAGPLPRSAIDYIRGVNSTFILRSLLLRGLIERSQDPKRANVYIYRTSFELMRHLGIGALGELPEYARFREVADKIKIEN